MSQPSSSGSKISAYSDINVSWTNNSTDSSDYVYYLEAYKKYADSSQVFKKWASVDIRNFDLGNKSMMNAFLNDISNETDTENVIPGLIFSPGDTVYIKVVGINYKNLKYLTEVNERFGTAQMVISKSFVKVTME